MEVVFVGMWIVSVAMYDVGGVGVGELVEYLSVFVGW